MNSQSGIPEPPAARDTRVGVVLRVVFFVALVTIGFFFIGPAFLNTLGVVVAGTLGLFLTGMLANFLTLRIFDRLPLIAIGLGTGRGSGRNLLLGVVLGAGCAALMLLAPLVAGTGHLVARSTPAPAWSGVLFYFVVLFFGATGEELIFRGYAFQLLIQKMGPFATILPVGVVFGLAHSVNPNASPVSVMNTILWGILLGYAFLRSHDLWLPIGLHYGWNVVLPLFGVNLSGLTIEVTRYFYRWDLKPLWSGGAYGPEGGLLTTIFVAGLFLILARAPVAPQTAAIARVLNAPESYSF